MVDFVFGHGAEPLPSCDFGAAGGGAAVVVVVSFDFAAGVSSPFDFLAFFFLGWAPKPMCAQNWGNGLYRECTSNFAETATCKLLILLVFVTLFSALCRSGWLTAKIPDFNGSTPH